VQSSDVCPRGPVRLHPVLEVPIVKLYIIESNASWSYSVTVVCAATMEEAMRLAYPHTRPELLDVEEHDLPTEPRVLWCHENEADSSPGAD
jgi:hypothetical protein